MWTARKIYCRVFQGVFRAALPFLPYRNPRIIPSVAGIGDVCKKKNVDSVMIVTDQGIRALGLTKFLEKSLEERGISYCIYDRTVANPTIWNVEEARELYLKEGAQAIIAFGGGSSMDCAKAAGARIVKPKQSIHQMKGLLKVHKKLPLLIAVPTTAGTGSETTLAAVITDSEKRHKYPINDFSLIPRYAVLDYHETTGLPRQITATTGMDALTHAVEAYIGGSTTRETRQMAEEAVHLVYQYLKAAYDDGGDKEARSGMLKAAYCAGVAFTKSYVGYVHAVAHSLGGQYGTPHGLANAVTLPVVLKIYGPACEKKLARLAKNAGVVDRTMKDQEAAHRFIEWIVQMNDSMEIPRHLPDIREEDIPVMARHADQEANPLYPVPVLMNRRELEEIYYKVKGG
ncbi:MAG TPA: alcohol dehydrogenase [Lachnospiraceae bacterium]|nr:alcohol dehydrogenase [Lachnospiraceae bacterium]